MFKPSAPPRKKTMVHVPELLGCIANGPTTEIALERTPGAMRAFLRFLAGLGIGGLMHCLGAGLSVPGRIALAGFNGIALVDAMPMRLTTIETPRFEMGVQAAQMLLADLEGRLAGCPRKLAMPLRVRQGDTT